jgi:hypothetical protein
MAPPKFVLIREAVGILLVLGYLLILPPSLGFA